MPKKCVILSFGFDSSIVLTAYSKYDLESGDCIAFIIPNEKNARAESAIKSVESFLSNLKSRGVDIDLKILEVDANSIEKIILKISDFILQNDYVYYLEATGGIRSICVALTISAILLYPKIASFSTINEANGNIINVSLPYFNLVISGAKKEILNLLLNKGNATTKTIATSLHKDISTVSRHLSELEESFIVEKDSKYDADYKLTYVGYIVAKKV